MNVDSDSSDEDIKFKFSPKTYTMKKSQSLKLKNNSTENESARKTPSNNSLLSKILPKQKCSSLAKVNNLSTNIEKTEGSSESLLNNKIDTYDEWDKNFLGNSYSSSQSSLTGSAKSKSLNQYARTRKNLEKIVKKEPNEPTVHGNTEVVSNNKTSSPAVTISSLKALHSPPSKVLSNSMMDMIKRWTIGPNLNVQNDHNVSLIKSDNKSCSDKIAMPNIKAPSKRKRSSPEIKQNGHIDVHDSPPYKKVKQSRNLEKNLVDISNATEIYPNSNNLSSVKRGSKAPKIIKSKVPDSPVSLGQSRNTKMKDLIKTQNTKDSESKSLSSKKKQSKTTRKNISSKSSKNNSPLKSTKTKKSKSTEKSTSKSTEKNTPKSTEKKTPKSTEKKTPKSTERNTSKSKEKNTLKSIEKNNPKSTEKNTAKSPKMNVCIDKAKRQLSNSFEIKSPIVVLRNINKELGELNSNGICTYNKSSKTDSEGMPKENHLDVSMETKSILHPKENFFKNGPNFCDEEQDPNESLNTTIMQSQSALIPYKNSIRKNRSECSSAIKVQNTSINTSSLQIQAAPINYENSNTYLSTVQTLQPNVIGNNYSNPSSLMLQPLSNAANSIVPVNNTLSVNHLHHSVAPNSPLTIMALQPFESASLVIMKCTMPLEDCVNLAKRTFSGVEVVSMVNNSVSQMITTRTCESYRTSEVYVGDHAVGFITDINLSYSNTLHIMYDKMKVMTLGQCKDRIKDHFTSSHLRVKQYYADQDIQRFYRNYFTPNNSENLSTHTEFNLNDDFENTPVYQVVKKYMYFHLAELLKLYKGNSCSSCQDIIRNSKFTFVEKMLLSDIFEKHDALINLKDLATSLTFLALSILFNEFKRREFERGEI